MTTSARYVRNWPNGPDQRNHIFKGRPVGIGSAARHLSAGRAIIRVLTERQYLMPHRR